MWVVTVMNQKGGVGKTTTTLNLAAALQEQGWRVLVVDFDPQSSLTACCGSNVTGQWGAGQTIADALLTTVHGPVSRLVSLEDVIVTTPSGIDLVPSSQQLATAESSLYTVYGREYALRDTLASARERYDVIIVDSVPTLGLLAVNGLAAADGLIIPVQAEYLAVYGLAQLLQNVALVQERLNRRLTIWGVLLTMVDVRTRHSREIVATVRETLPGHVPLFDTCVPVDVKLKDSTRAGVSVLRYDPLSRSAQAYRALGIEVERLLTGKPSLTEVPGSGVDLPPQASPQRPRTSSEQMVAEARSGQSSGIPSLASRLGLRSAALGLSRETSNHLSTNVANGAATPASHVPERLTASSSPAGIASLQDAGSPSPDVSIAGYSAITSPAADEASAVLDHTTRHDGPPAEVWSAWQESDAETSTPGGPTPRAERDESDRGSHQSVGKSGGSDRFTRSFKILRRLDWHA
jgi:chromosome partitioning protein